MDILREIREKRKMLMERRPFGEHAALYMKVLDELDLLYCTMRLSGSALSRDEAARLLKGEFLEKASVEDHLKAERYKALLKHLNDLAEMDFSIDTRIINELYTLINGEAAVYRMSRPVLYGYYRPPAPYEICEQMELLTHTFEDAGDEIAGAVEIHNRMIEVWPFEKSCEELARLCMFYSLIRDGYPVFSLNFSPAEYEECIISYLKTGSSEKLYDVVCRALFNKLELMLRLTEEDTE